MNILKSSSFLLLLFSCTFFFNKAQAQNAKQKKAQEKAAYYTSLITSKRYVFKAQTVMPTGSRNRQLTSDYDLRVLGDTLVCYLPYFGRAFAPPVDLTRGGFQFTSTNFDYTIVDNKKKNGWDILMKPKDVNDVRDLSLSIFENGNATLRINSDNRQPIAFDGYITEPEKKKHRD